MTLNPAPECAERRGAMKAVMQAEAFLNRHPSHRVTFIGEIDRRDEALQEVQRENVESSEAQINYHE
jgi:hypothetical protein